MQKKTQNEKWKFLECFLNWHQQILEIFHWWRKILFEKKVSKSAPHPPPTIFENSSILLKNRIKNWVSSYFVGYFFAHIICLYPFPQKLKIMGFCYRSNPFQNFYESFRYFGFFIFIQNLVFSTQSF
jgi:hypothetical protein